MPNENVHLEGTVSQNCYISPRFYFMKCRKIIMKTKKNLPVFCYKNKSRTYIKILRHGSLQMNVLSMSIKSQVCTVNNKRDILDKKIKVKKSVLNFPFRQLSSNYYFIHMAG